MILPRHHPLTVALARAKLVKAQLAWQEHSNECTMWDYESSNGCEDCERCRADVRAAFALHREGRE